MACANPFNLFDDNQQFIGSAPCGRCVNCLIDSRNQYDDLCQEELFQKNFVGSYLTLTYDDYHINWVDDFHGHLAASLRKSDAVKFVKRLRSYIARYKINNPFCRPDFRYIVAGEYGETNTSLPRPHLHFVFFGLDYRFCAEIFRKCWTFGNQKLLPIENGCFRYVISYMGKQVKCYDNPYDVYEAYNKERPFFHHSVGLGKTLFNRQWDYIKNNDYYYLSRKGVKRPLPVYYMRRYALIRANNTINDKIKFFKIHKGLNNKTFSIKKYNQLKHEIALAREASLTRRLRDSGECVPLPYSNMPGYWNTKYKDYLSKSVLDSGYQSEARSALRDYLRQEQLTNNFVIHQYKNNPDIKAVFTDSKGEFIPCSLFPMYKNHRQVAHDLARYGSLVPF